MIRQLKQPVSNLTEVLHDLIITRTGVSERKQNQNGFRARISELILKHNIPIQNKVAEFSNKYGTKSHYKLHYIDSADIQEVVDIYEKLILQSNKRRES